MARARTRALRRPLPALLGASCALFVYACGSRSEAPILVGTRTVDNASLERCNGLDDDGKHGVDDPFRDKEGRYLTDEHCGACNSACTARPDSEREVHCRLVEELPRCVASRCADGHRLTRDGHCAPIDERLCLPCASALDCGSLIDARCASIGGESRCTIACGAGCPSGTTCDRARAVCVPSGGSCSCKPGQMFEYACALDDVMRAPDAGTCVGSAQCDNGKVSACSVPEETCDEQDNDCDGRIDEGFRDPSGTYSLNPAHCGQCGASCLEDTGVDQRLVCGGDPFAPRCALACPDSLNGIAPGDRLDGDLDLATGCECVVQRLQDVPGPLLARAELLDENCDGADGIVRESFYVASDGNDMNAGSPTRPLRTIGAAVARASASLSSMAPRPHVYIASGSYTETITLADGVSLHGGYRRDFRALDPSAFTVEVRAPRGSRAPGGAALVAVDVGRRGTVVQWLTLRGLDAENGGAAVGAYFERPGALLALGDLTIQAGVPGEGVSGTDGVAGSAPTTQAGSGEAPRAARENGSHVCIAEANVVRGGGGGRAMCGGGDVRGGEGGSAGCPTVQGAFQPPGSAGRASSGASGGAGGQGGQDCEGPIEDPACPGGLCCGLADFQVPTNFQGPRPGGNGTDGEPGAAGEGCSGGDGRFMAGVWSGGVGANGGDGLPGSGGGGGGSGGGALMNFDARFCAFEDGLGGGGGGGGAGGCGGLGGRGGANGAPSVALVVIDARSAFTLSNVTLKTAVGGRGGAGGAGGSGAAGGGGASGGALAMASRTTPPLAGPFPGARGGTGGAGGVGGGAGGGCGGASVGIWIVGNAQSSGEWQARNMFQLAGGGAGGAGGGGARAGRPGASGKVANVVVQI